MASIPARKSPLRNLPAGADPTKYTRAADLNGLIDALTGAGDAITPNIASFTGTPTGNASAASVTATGANAAHSNADRWANVHWAGDFTTFAGAIAVANASGKTLVIHAPVTVATALGTISAPLRFEGGGRFVFDTGGSVTLSGPLTAPLGQIFALGTASNFGGLTFSAQVTEVQARWTGAVGDGATDDTLAIQRAINAAGAGRRVRLGPGTFLVSGLTINVDGATFDFAGGQLKQKTGTANTPVLSIGDNSTLRTGVRLRSVNIDGNKSNVSGNSAHGVVIQKVADVSIDMATFTNVRRDALYGYNVQGLVVGRIDTADGGVTGAALGSGFDLDTCLDVSIHSFRSTNGSGVAGIAHRTHGLRIGPYSVATNAVDNGLTVDTSSDVSIESYTIDGAANQGIELNSTSGFRIGPGTVTNSGVYGVLVNVYTGAAEQAATAGSIDGLVTSGNATNGLRIIGGQNVSVRNATIADGAHVTNSAGGVVAQDILFEKTTINALTLNSGSRITLRDAGVTTLTNVAAQYVTQDTHKQVVTGVSVTVVNGASVDVAIPATSSNPFAGLLAVASYFTSSFSQNTSALYHVNQLGTTVITSLSTSSGSTPRQVTVTAPDNKTVRITNSTGVDCKVIATFLVSAF